ncbi:hypothetical protein L3Q82_022149, partial [Scortum barcoo]
VFYYQEAPFPPQEGRFKGHAVWSGDVLRRDASITLHEVPPTFNGTYICQVRNLPDVHGSNGEIVLKVVNKASISEIGLLAAAVGGACGAILIILGIFVAVRFYRRRHSGNNEEVQKQEHEWNNQTVCPVTTFDARECEPLRRCPVHTDSAVQAACRPLSEHRLQEQSCLVLSCVFHFPSSSGVWSAQALEMSVGKIPFLEAVNGSTVMLPCTYSSCIGIKNLYFNWQFNDNGTMQKVCDSVIPSEGVVPHVSIYRDRVEFVGNNDHNNISIMLWNITFEDGGQYTCFGRNPKEKGKNHSAIFTLIVVDELRVVDNTLATIIASAVGGAIAAIMGFMLLKNFTLFVLNKMEEKKNHFKCTMEHQRRIFDSTASWWAEGGRTLKTVDYTVHSEDVGSTRLYFVNASLQRVTYSSSVGVSLPCPAGGTPSAILRWYLATGDDIYDVPHIRHVHANGTLLQLYPFSPSAYNSYIHDNDYFCTAENQAGKIRSPNIRIKAVFREPYTVRVADQRSMRGNVAVFKCLIPAAVQEYVSVVSWERDTVSIIPEFVRAAGLACRMTARPWAFCNRFSLTSFGALYISDVQKEDALSTYRCITKHKYSGETRQSNGARLSVMDPNESSPTILDSFQAGEVYAGQSIELPCAAGGYPSPTVRWLKDGRPLPSDARWTRRLTGLTISDLRQEDSGSYACEVTNSFGSKEVSGQLHVIDPLRVTLSPKNLKTGISSTLFFTCTVEGSPEYTITWYSNTEPIVPDQHISIQGQHNDTLQITAAQKFHSGAYQCFASRKGHTAQDFSIILLEDGTPRIVSSFSERVVNPGEPFSLMCAAKGAPPPPLHHLDTGRRARGARDSTYKTSQYTLSDGLTVSHVNVSSPLIRDGESVSLRPPRIRPMRDITAVAGRNTYITCRVIGYPYYSIKWLKDGMQLPDNHRQVVFENGTLRLTDVQKGADEGTYLCSVLIQPQVSINQTVHVTVKVPPLIQPFDIPSTSVGKLMYIACVVSSGDMPIRITWHKDGQLIVPGSASGVAIETKEFMSSLQISKVTLKHNGNYTCIASNAAATVSWERQLIVTVPPRFVVQPNNQDCIYGKAGVLNCSVEGYPPPKVMWKHAKGVGNPQQYHPVPLTGRIQIMSNGSLLIRHVLEDDRGYYLCQASNGVGSDISKSMILTVKIPAMITSHPNTTMARKGQTKELNCTARGEQPIIIRWERGDTVIDAERNPRYSITINKKGDEVISTLKLNPAERGDSVFFSCHAINSYGEGRGLIQLTVQEPPDPPELEVREVKDRSMNLRWIQRFDGNSIITSYDIEYKNKSDSWDHMYTTRNISPTNNQANIVELHPACVYSIRMYSYNKIGRSLPSKELTISTEEAPPDGPPMDVILQPMTSQSIRVTWRAPKKELQNGVIRGYQIGYRENGPGSNGQYSIVEMKATGDSEVYTLDNLKKFAQYGVVVQAFNRAGTGPSSTEINATTLEDVPSEPPQNVRAISVTSDEAVITWAEPPRLTLHGVLKGYRVVFWSLFPDGEWGEMLNITTTREQVELRGLEKFTNYSVQVLAYTQAGDGVRSNVLYIQTREDRKYTHKQKL